jgi:hypothetical protein
LLQPIPCASVPVFSFYSFWPPCRPLADKMADRVDPQGKPSVEHGSAYLRLSWRAIGLAAAAAHFRGHSPVQNQPQYRLVSPSNASKNKKSCRASARNSRIPAGKGRLHRENATCRDGREQGERTHRYEFMCIFLCSFVANWSFARRVVALRCSATGTVMMPKSPKLTLSFGKFRWGYYPMSCCYPPFRGR